MNNFKHSILHIGAKKNFCVYSWHVSQNTSAITMQRFVDGAEENSNVSRSISSISKSHTRDSFLFVVLHTVSVLELLLRTSTLFSTRGFADVEGTGYSP